MKKTGGSAGVLQEKENLRAQAIHHGSELAAQKVGGKFYGEKPVHGAWRAGRYGIAAEVDEELSGGGHLCRFPGAKSSFSPEIEAHLDALRMEASTPVEGL